MGILRTAPMQRLTCALDGLVADDPSFASARSFLLQPLDTLAALACDAEPVLRDDENAMERMHLVLTLAAARAITLKSALVSGDTTRVDASARASVGSTNDALPLRSPSTQALVDLGVLVVVGLAAGRIGRRHGLVRPFVDAVCGLALGAARAEAIARALAAGLQSAQLRVVLLALASTAREDLAAVVPLLLDGCERTRWRCLQQLFAEIEAQAASTAWEAVVSSPIVAVTHCTESDTLQIELALPSATAAEVDPGELVDLLDPTNQEIHVVFASPGRPALAQKIESERSSDRITVRVPPDARAGWIGLTSDPLRSRTRESLARVRRHWERRATSPCLLDCPVPDEALAGLGESLGAAPRTAEAEWGVRVADVIVRHAHAGTVGMPDSPCACPTGQREDP